MSTPTDPIDAELDKILALHTHPIWQDSHEKAKAALRRLIVEARIDEDWKTREYVTLHHYDTTAGRRTDEYLEQRIATLTSADAKGMEG